MSSVTEARRSDAMPWTDAAIITGSSAKLTSTHCSTTFISKAAQARTMRFPRASWVWIASSNPLGEDEPCRWASEFSYWLTLTNDQSKQLRRYTDSALQNAALSVINTVLSTRGGLPQSTGELTHLVHSYNRILTRIRDDSSILVIGDAPPGAATQNHIHIPDHLYRHQCRSVQQVVNAPLTEADFGLGFDTAGVLTKPSSLAREKTRLLGELRAYGKMEQGWDGDDAESLRPDAVGKARAFLDALERRAEDEGMASDRVYPKLDPARDGSMTLFWAGDNFFASIDFDGTEEVQWYVRSADGRRDGDNEAFDGFALPPRFWELLSPHLS